MLKIEYSKKGFQIFFKEKLFLTHTVSNPAFKIGIGQSTFKMRQGSFKIKEKVLKETVLRQFIVNKVEPEEISITLQEHHEKLELSIQINNKRLELIPKVSQPNINRLKIKLYATPEENIYGCGSRFSEFNLRGKRIPIWVEDATPILRQGKHIYFPQSLFLSISSDKYFCFIDTTSYLEFDFTNQNQHNVYVWGIPKKIVIGKYNSAIEVVKNISDYFGRQPKIPNWVYDGIILGIQGGNEIVEKKISIALEADIPVNAVWCQDWQGIRMTSLGQQLFWNWIYDKKLYPDLPKFIKNLHKQNIKFLGYICALLNIEGDQYKEAEKNGYLLKDKSGTPITIRSSDFLVGIVDFSNRDATQWFKNIIKNEMIKIGLDGWMTDYGEYCVTNASIELDLEGANFHNYYPVLYAKSVYEVLKETNTLSELFVFHRTGYNESIPYMMSYWAGDQLVNWDKELGLPSVIPCGLSIGLGGVGNYHFDIGGFTTYREFKREKETFIRWVELGAFSLIMRTHEGNMPSKNWQFDSDEETLHHLSKMVKIHVILKPYIKSLEEEYQELGIPPMRPCFLHYEQDQTLNNLKFQYLFGRDLLVAPVIKPDKQTWKVYLPEDDWIHIWTEKEYKSGWLEIESPLGEPPVFYRKESLFRNIFRSVFHLHYSYSNPE